MKLRKILALASAAALAITATVFSPMMSDSADGATYKLVQGEMYDMGGGAMAIPVDVYVTLPETFVAYESKFSVTPTPGTYYSGKVLQFLSIEIPYVDGLMFINDSSMSSIKDEALATAGCAITDNATAQKVQIFMNQTTAANMYSGTLNHVASLTYFVTGTADSYTIEPSDVYAKVYSWDGTTTATATATEYAMDSFNQTVEAEKYAVTVTGGTANVENGVAEEDQEVTVTASVPEGKVIDSIEASVEYTDNGNGTYTFTMPAAAVTFTINYVDEVIEFNVDATKNTTTTYTTEDDKTVEIFNCTATGATESTTWYFTFEKGEVQKTFTATNMPTIQGNASAVFEAWVISTGGGVGFVSATDAQ